MNKKDANISEQSNLSNNQNVFIRTAHDNMSLRTGNQMPKQMNGNFYGIDFSGIDIDMMTMDQLRDNFLKFLPDDTPGEQGDRMDPSYMKAQYEKLGLNRQNPSMYSMVCWMTKNYLEGENDGKGLSFEDFIQQAIFFFSQRHHEVGLRYIFQLFDKDNKGITIDQFEEMCESLDFYLSKKQLNQFFLRGSKDGKVINFQDFAAIMRKENYK